MLFIQLEQANEEHNLKLLIAPLAKSPKDFPLSTVLIFNQYNETMLCSKAFSKVTLKFVKIFFNKESHLFLLNFFNYF